MTGGQASEHPANVTDPRAKMPGGQASEHPANVADPRAKRPGGQASEHPANVADPRAKRPGGQPGNHNAYKHGFYSHLFRERERRILDDLPITDLSAEIELLHVTTARFLEAMESSNRTQDYESSITALRLVNLSAQSIAALVRVQAITGALSREAEEALQESASMEDESGAEQASSPYDARI
jgi:hypothetical protein